MTPPRAHMIMYIYTYAHICVCHFMYTTTCIYIYIYMCVHVYVDVYILLQDLSTPPAHAYVHTQLHISFRRVDSKLRCYAIISAHAMCTFRHNHNNKHSHGLRLRMELETGTLDRIIQDRHIHTRTHSLSASTFWGYIVRMYLYKCAYAFQQILEVTLAREHI